MDDALAFDEYEKHQRRRTLSAATIVHSRRELLILQRYLDCPVMQATPVQLLAWVDSIEDECKEGSRYAKISRIHSFYKWAHGEDLIERIPTARIPRPRVRPGLPRPTPRGEVMRALDSAGDEMRLWVMLGAFAGLRCCEIAQLGREQIFETAEPPHLRVVGKGNKERIIFLCPDLVTELHTYPLPSYGWVFARRDGKPGHPSASIVSQYGNSFLHGAGIKETMHQLRHRYGTDVYEASDLLTTASLMGHSNLQTTRGYAKLSDAKAINATRSLGRTAKPSEAA